MKQLGKKKPAVIKPPPAHWGGMQHALDVLRTRRAGCAAKRCFNGVRRNALHMRRVPDVLYMWCVPSVLRVRLVPHVLHKRRVPNALQVRRVLRVLHMRHAQDVRTTVKHSNFWRLASKM